VYDKTSVQNKDGKRVVIIGITGSGNIYLSNLVIIFR
jgi:hypothetical protein